MRYGASKRSSLKNLRTRGMKGGSSRTLLLRAAGRRQAQILGGITRFPDLSPATAGFRGRSGGEIKGCDTLLGGTLLSSTSTNGGITIVNPVQAGTGSWNRIGRRITMKSLRIKGAIETVFTPNAVTGAFAIPTIRMAVVYDRQISSGTLPNFDAIFGRTDQTGAEGSGVFDPLRYDNMDRFAVLLDRMWETKPGVIQSGGTTNALTYNFPVDEYIKLRGLETNYASTSNPITSADISTGALYVIFRTNEDGAENVNTVALVARLRYLD